MWLYPNIIAHRGGGTLAPENTLAAMRCGWSHGFRAVEFDVMLSKDKVPVLMHDAMLGRTVGGSGCIADYTAQELNAMDAGSWFGKAYAGEPVPTLSQVWRFCLRHRIWMNIEIKPVPGHEEETGAIVAGAVSSWMAAMGREGHAPDAAARPLFSSFSYEALAAAKKAAPSIACGVLMNPLASNWRETARQLDAATLHVQHGGLSRQQIAAVKEAGLGLFCYTVNDPARARDLLGWGVDAICTDRIDLIGPDFR